MKITTNMVGKKVRKCNWTDKNWYIIVKYVGNYQFFGEDKDGNEHEWLNGNKVDMWELVEEKKLYAPAFYFVTDTWYKTTCVFSCITEATKYVGTNVKLVWPAPLPNKNGYYEIEG